MLILQSWLSGKKHGPEVDNVVSEAYGELRDASKQG
jgi:hypothetical protein